MRGSDTGLYHSISPSIYLLLPFLSLYQDEPSLMPFLVGVTSASGDLSQVHVRSRFIVKAHEKDINTVALAPNDKIIATGSQDKTIKVSLSLLTTHCSTRFYNHATFLRTGVYPTFHICFTHTAVYLQLWAYPALTPLASLSGHRRGVWCVEFSPVDQCLASCSSDRTVKLWSLTDYTCLKAREAHTLSGFFFFFFSFFFFLVLPCSSSIFFPPAFVFIISHALS